MKKISYTSRGSKYELTSLSITVSEAMVRQILEAIKADMVEICGDYNWQIEQGHSSSPSPTAKYPRRIKTTTWYEIGAYWRKDRWTDGKGKTPKEALLSMQAVRTILTERYGVKI